MNSVTKKEIQRLIEKSTAREPLIVNKTVKLTIISYLLTIPGIICWIIVFYIPIDPFEQFAITLLGSCFLGLYIFTNLVGNHLYFKFHNKLLPVNRIYNAYFRTFSQFYHWGSYIIIFFSTQRFNSTYSIEFFVIFAILSIPTFLGYPFYYSQKVITWFEGQLGDETLNK